MAQDFVNKGCVGQAQTKVDRYFYLYDVQSDLVFEMDGFLQPRLSPGDPQRWMLILMCPACHQGLRIDTAKKPILIDERGIESGEPIGCSYLLDDVDGYSGLCPARWELQPYDKPEYGEVRTETGEMVRVRIDAKIRRAL